MITVKTRIGNITFPTTIEEAQTWSTGDLRECLLHNDPNGEWANVTDEGPTREDMIEQAVAFGREALEDREGNPFTEGEVKRAFMPMLSEVPCCGCCLSDEGYVDAITEAVKTLGLVFTPVELKRMAGPFQRKLK